MSLAILIMESVGFVGFAGFVGSVSLVGFGMCLFRF